MGRLDETVGKLRIAYGILIDNIDNFCLDKISMPFFIEEEVHV